MDREDYYSFVADWLKDAAAKRSIKTQPLMVGLSAAQGIGKTTLTRQVCVQLAAEGIPAVAISIDDFYLTHQEQRALAQNHPGNPYLRHRGYPGTHDIALGERVLTALKEIGLRGSVALPSYDRSAFGGRGDRRPESDWPVVHAPLEIVILEGWMLGFSPVDPERLPDRHLRVINDYLAQYSVWDRLLGAFVWLEPEDYAFVPTWRAEAEARSRAEGHGGMSNNEVLAFVETFMPAYSIYGPGLRDHPPVTSGPVLHLVIGRDRLPV